MVIHTLKNCPQCSNNSSCLSNVYYITATIVNISHTFILTKTQSYSTYDDTENSGVKQLAHGHTACGWKDQDLNIVGIGNQAEEILPQGSVPFHVGIEFSFPKSHREQEAEKGLESSLLNPKLISSKVKQAEM